MNREALKRRLQATFRGSATKRFHTIRTVHENTVGQHSFGVAMLYYIIAIEPSLNGVMTALTHDLAEYKTGDVPAPAKRELGLREQFAAYEANVMAAAGFPAFEATLDADDKWVVKLADALDGLVFCGYERKMGNRQANEAFDNFCQYVTELLNAPGIHPAWKERGRQVADIILENFEMGDGL